MPELDVYNFNQLDEFTLKFNLDSIRNNEKWNYLPKYRKIKILKIKSKTLRKTLEFINSKKFYEELNKEDHLFFISINVAEEIPRIKLDLRVFEEHVSLERCLIMQWISISDIQIYIKQVRKRELSQLNYEPLRFFQTDADFKEKLLEQRSFDTQLLIDAITSEFGSVFRKSGSRNLLHVAFNSKKEFDSWRFIDYAALSGDSLSLRILLLLSKWDLKHKNNDGKTVLEIAAKEAEDDALAAILHLPVRSSANLYPLEKGLKNLLKIKNSLGNTPLLEAATQGKARNVRLLIQYGADPYYKNALKKNAMDIAWSNKHFACVQALLEADVPFPENFNAAEFGQQILNQRRLKKLVENREKFHNYIKTGDLENIKKVLSLRTKPLKKFYNQKNQSALTTAINAKQFEIYAFLLSRGFCSDEYKKNEQQLPINEKIQLRNAKKIYFKNPEAYHIIEILCQTNLESENSMDRFQEIKNIYEKLDAIPENSKMLEAIAQSAALKITYDFNAQNVLSFEPTVSIDAIGVFRYCDNGIFVAGDMHLDPLRATAAHELMHFIMEIIYSNECKPYGKLDNERVEFESIVDECKEKLDALEEKYQIKKENELFIETIKEDLDPIIARIFMLYESFNWSSELIVRVPQMFAYYGDEVGRKKLSKQTPNLLHYYKNKIEPVLDDYKFSHIRAKYYETKYKIQKINYQLGVFKEIEKLKLRLITNFLQENFQLNQDGQDLLIIEAGVSALTCLFLYQKMQSNKHFYYIFSNLLSFKIDTVADDIMDLLETYPTSRLIIDCESLSDDNKIENVLDAIADFEDRRRIIFITSADNTDIIKGKISILYPNFHYKKEKIYSLADFTVDSKKNLFERRNIILQEDENERSLNDLGISFTDNYFKFDDVFTGQTLVELDLEKKIELGSDTPYISDTLALARFRTYVAVDINLLTRNLNDKNSADIFAFVSEDKKEISQLFPQIPDVSIKKFSEGEFPFSTVRIILLHSNKKKEQFKLLCRKIEDYAFEDKKTLTDNKPILFLLEKGSKKTNDENWYLTQLYQHDYVSRTFSYTGDSSNTIDYNNNIREQGYLANQEIHTIIDNNDSEFLEPSNRVVILSGEVHEGKSMTLMHLSKLVKYNNKNSFIWIINLLEHEAKLKNLEDLSESEVMKFLISLDKKLTTLVQIAIFKYQLQQLKKVSFFFDGFSELKSNNKKYALNLFYFLINKTNAGIWITSRAGKYRKELETHLGISGYVFNEVEKSQKINFLSQLWTASLKLKYDSALLGAMKPYAAMIIERLPPTKEVINSLLHIRMIAETYHKKMKKEVILNRWSQSNRQTNDFNLGTLLEKFVYNRFEINFDKTNQINKKFFQHLLEISLQNSAMLNIAFRGVCYKEINHDEISFESIDTLTGYSFTLNALEYHFSKNPIPQAYPNTISPEEMRGIQIAETLDLYPFSQSVLEYYIAKNIVFELCNAKIKARSLFPISEWFFEEVLENDRFIRHSSILNRRGIRNLVSEILINNFSVEPTRKNVLLEELTTTENDIFSSEFSPKLDTIIREDLLGVFEYLVRASKLKDEDKKFKEFNKNKYNILHDIAIYGNVKILEFIFNENLINKESINFGVARSLINKLESQSFDYDPSSYAVEHTIYPKPAMTPLLLSVQSDNISIFSILLKHQAYLNAVSSDGFNLFHFIAMFNYKNFLEEFIILLESNTFEKITLWERRGHQNNVERIIEDIASYRLEIKKLVNAKISASYAERTPIMIAAVNCGEEVISNFIKLGAKPHYLDKNGFTPLMIAAENGNVEALKALLSNRVVVEKINYLQYTNNRACEFFATCGYSALLWAVKGGYNDMVKLLISNGADVEAKDKNGNTALLLAVKYGYHAIVKTLVIKGANTKVKNNKGENWLHLSVEAGDPEMASTILYHSENIKEILKTPTESGDTPLHLAAKFDSEKLARKLLSEAARVLFTADLFIGYLESTNKKNQTPLDLAIKRENGNKIISEIIFQVEKLYLREQTEVITKYLEQIIVKTGGGTLLHLAVLAGNKEITLKLLKKNIDIEATNKLGNTVLHLAAERAYHDITKILIANKAKVNAKNKLDETPLHLAAEGGLHEAEAEYIEIVKTLIFKGAKVNDKNKSGETPLHLATKFGLHEIVNTLLFFRANIEDTDEFGNTALHLAVQNRSFNIVKKFIIHGANLEAVNKFGDTPLLMAIEDGCLETVKLLLSNGASLDVANNKGDTALFIATKKGDPEIVKIALLYGANIKFKNNRGDTPLHWAAKYGNQRIAKIFLLYGADIEVQNNSGDTALDFAEVNNKYEIVKLFKSKLDRANSPVSVENTICSTPHLIATRKKRDIIQKECEINWEDIDQFNEEKEYKRDIDKIKINSNLFLEALNKPLMTSKKRQQLLELAGNAFVIGKSADQVAQLINHKKSLDHLRVLGNISNKLTSGLMIKNMAADFVNGDYKDVAINIGIIAWPSIVAAGERLASPGLESGLQLAKKFIPAGTLKLSSEVEVMLSRSVRVTSSFMKRGTAPFIAFDLVNQFKAYNNGADKADAIVGIVSDSIYLGVDATALGVETAETLGVFAGVSATTGPIGDVVVITVFAVTEIYSAASTVSKLDQKIHLTNTERLIEGLRAFVRMKPESYLENLLEEQQVNNHLVNQGLNYLTSNPNIQRYIFPTAKPISHNCNPECQYKLITDTDSKILLDYKRKNIKLSRAKPSIMTNQVFCVPRGDDDDEVSDEAYVCENAIGVSFSGNRPGNVTFIALGEGKDTLRGFSESNHVVWVEEGEKDFALGKGNDSFILAGKQITGSLDGGGGINTLDAHLFLNASRQVLELFMHLGRLQYPVEDGNYNFLNLNRIQQIFLRSGKKDIVHTNCDTHHVDMRGGENSDQPDTLIIPSIDSKLNQTCDYDLTVVIRPDTYVENKANSGKFTYIIPDINVGEATVDLTASHSMHHFNIDFKNFSNVHYIHRFKNDNFTVSFGFTKNLKDTQFSPINVNNTQPTIDNIFKLTVNCQPSKNITYVLADGTQIKLTEKNVYALQQTDRPIKDFIQDYPKIASRLRMSIFVQSSRNETMAIGHGQHDVLYNDPNRRSHLIGNGGGNIIVVTSEHNKLDWSKLPVPEVILYDVDDEASIDTLDLSKIKKQLTQDLGLEFYVKTRWSADDLIIELCDAKSAKIAVVVVLKEAKLKNWSERLHILLDHAPMKLNGLELKPVPLQFTGYEKYIVISQYDVEKGTQVVVPKITLGDYKFAKSENNLVLTNLFDPSITHANRISLLLIEFYKMHVQPLLISLSIKFYDKEIILRDEIEKINNATTLNDPEAYYACLNKAQDEGAEQTNGCYDFVTNSTAASQNASMQNSNLEYLSSEPYFSSNPENKNINIFSNEIPEQTKYIVYLPLEVVNDENNSLPMQCLTNDKLKKGINKTPNNEKIAGNFRNASIAVDTFNVHRLAEEIKPNKKILDFDSKNSSDNLTHSANPVDSWIKHAIAWVNNSLFNSSGLSEGIFVNKIASNDERSNQPTFPLANRVAPRTVELERCKFGAQNGQQLAKGITCYSENMKIMLFIKNSPPALENPTMPFLQQDCQLITFNGRPSIYCENEHSSNVYQPEILGNHLEQLNSNIMLLQVVLHQGKKMCSWAQNLFVQEKTVSSAFSETYLITANQKKQWKEIIAAIEKNLTELDPEKFELRWIWHILEDRKEEFEILCKKLHSNIEEVNLLTENLKELQEEIEITEDLFSTTHNDIHSAQKVENTQNNKCFKEYFSWLTQGFFQEKICVRNLYIPEVSNNSSLSIGQN